MNDHKRSESFRAGVHRRNSARWWLLALSLLQILATTSLVAQALEIRANYDVFETLDGTRLQRLAGIPAGFFGSYQGLDSDPIIDPIELELVGTPIEGEVYREIAATGFVSPTQVFQTNGCWTITKPVTCIHCSGALTWDNGQPLPSEPERVSTIVQRLDSVSLPKVGSKGSSGLRFVALSLATRRPIKISYGGGAAYQTFDATVTLNPDVVQQVGTIILTRTGADSGTFDSRLPIRARLTLTNTDPKGPSAIEPIDDALELDDLIGSKIPFTVE